MDPFKDFFKLGVNKRHRKPILGGTDLEKKHLNVVPAKYKADNTLNKKIETLKKQPGKFVCDNRDIKYIVDTFLKGRMPMKNEMKTLERTGISFYQDARDGKWYVEKKLN